MMATGWRFAPLHGELAGAVGGQAAARFLALAATALAAAWGRRLALSLLLIGSLTRGADLESPRPVVRSAGETGYPPFCIVDSDGKASGFSVELLRAALAARGRDVTFRTGPWSDVKEWLARGEVDALPLVGRTPEREQAFDFTFPYLTLHGAIVVREGTSGIGSLADLAGRRVAVMRGDNAEEFLRRTAPQLTIETTATFEEALRDLAAGQYDAVVIQRLLALRLIQQARLTNLRLVEEPVTGFAQEFCFAVRDGDRDLLAVLNEGLALVMADGTFRRLHAKWFAALELDPHRVIVIGGDHNYPPYEFLDQKGRPAGFNVDLTRAVAKEAGFDVQIRLGPWNDVVQALERGEIDAVQGMFYSPERGVRFAFSPPHNLFQHVAVGRQGAPPPPTTVEGLAGKRIAVMESDIMHDFLDEQGLGEQATDVSCQEDALREVAEGRCDYALVARVPALYWIRERGWKNLIVAARPLLATEYCYAVARDRQALLALLSEGLSTVEETGEYHRIQQKWLGVYGPHGPRFTTILAYVALGAVPLLLALWASLAWSRSLRRQVRLRTADLERSQAMFLAALSTSQAGIIIADASDGAIRFVNQAALDIHGGTTERLVDGVRSQDYAAAWQLFRANGEPYAEGDDPLSRAMFHGETSSAEVIVRRDDGEQRVVWTNAAPIRDAAGRLSAGIVVLLDITAHRRAEAALQSSQARYETLVASIPDLVWLKDEDGVYLSCNPTFCRFFGAPVTEIVGKTDYDYVDRELADFFRDHDRQAMAAGRPTANEEWLTFADTGYHGLFETIKTPVRDADGSLLGVLGIARDITARAQAEGALRDSEDRYRALVEHAPVAIMVNREDRCVLANEACLRLFGATEPGQLLGKSPYELFHPDCHDRVRERLRYLRDANVPAPMAEERIVRLDGGPVDVEVSAAPFSDREGHAIHLVLRDLTEHNRAEEEQEDLRGQLVQAQKMESIGRLAGGVAHDFNNKLMAILGYAQLCQLELDAEHPVREYIDEIVVSAKLSADLTRQLLAFARKQAIVPEVLDLNDTVSGMLKMLQRLIGEDIRLAWRPGPRLWPVLMDPSQVDQLLANLAVNGRDAIGGVGMIGVETANVVLDAAYCADHLDAVPGEYVVLSVTDDGCGMTPETQAHIFEPFFTTKAAGQGTGLGLATVYGIARQNNGFITLYSEPGQGSTFRIHLPRATAEQGVVRQDEAKQPLPRGTETVLLVEDEHALLRSSALLLGQLGYTVLAAPGPAEALALARAGELAIDVVLTDVVMPEMNGRDLWLEIARLRPTARCVFMSGYTADIIAQRRVLDRGIHFLQKPFSLRALALKMREALDSPPAGNG